MKNSLVSRSLWLLCLVALPFSGSLLSARTAQAQAQAAPNQTLRDVAYGEVDSQKLLLDVYGADPAQKRPAIIFVHGGAWRSGSKNDLGFAAQALSREGYVGFSINYRLVHDGKNRYPAQLDDVQRAVRWVRAHAKDYGVDPERIGALGASAGGHLVALLGTTDTRDNSDAALATYSSRVSCVVDLYGPTDFTPVLQLSEQQRKVMETSPGGQMIQDFLGPLPENADNYREASPLSHIDGKTVPFLIFHGGKDDLVPTEQSLHLDEALRAANIESKLIVFPEAGHGYSQPELLAQTFGGALQFFNRHLKDPKPVAN